MAFDVDNFKFNSIALSMSGANFKAFLKETYGKKYKAKELNEVHKKFYGKKDVENGEPS